MNKIVYTLFLLMQCAILGCSKIDVNLAAGIKIVGHGGMGTSSQYPINSLESIHGCLNSGADGVEFDIQMTKDGKLVAFHDQDLSGSTQLSGLVYHHTLNEVEEAIYTLLPYASYEVVSLDAIFQSIEDPQKYDYVFECKLHPSEMTNGYIDSFARAVHSFVTDHHLSGVAHIESAEGNFLIRLHQIDNSLHLFYYTADVTGGAGFVKLNGLSGIAIRADLISKDQIDSLRIRDVLTSVYSVVNIRELKAALLKKPYLVQVDDVNRLMNALD